MSGREDQPATVPPPAGEDDAYSATTKVGVMPAEIMARLKAEGLLPDDSPAEDSAKPTPVPARLAPPAAPRPAASVPRPAAGSGRLSPLPAEARPRSGAEELAADSNLPVFPSTPPASGGPPLAAGGAEPPTADDSEPPEQESTVVMPSLLSQLSPFANAGPGGPNGAEFNIDIPAPPPFPPNLGAAGPGPEAYGSSPPGSTGVTAMTPVQTGGPPGEAALSAREVAAPAPASGRWKLVVAGLVVVLGLALFAVAMLNRGR